MDPLNEQELFSKNKQKLYHWQLAKIVNRHVSPRSWFGRCIWVEIGKPQNVPLLSWQLRSRRPTYGLAYRTNLFRSNHQRVWLAAELIELLPTFATEEEVKTMSINEYSKQEYLEGKRSYHYPKQKQNGGIKVCA
jgi:hypothetical protein